ncbi:MAG: hypothetical protein E7552_03330 [Ruminococcaceae bacterium]|nr:hypothetical protein [Oscillospiraceae bacterium]
MMKRFLCALLTICVVWACGGMTVLAVNDTAEYVFSQDNEGYLFQQTEGDLTFWEAPNVVTGQTRSGGVITLKNAADCTVDFSLASVSLPYGDVEALAYLDAVTLIIEQDGREVYRGPFTRLMDGDRAPITVTDVPAGESRELHMTVFCAFTYTGSVPAYESLVWTFEPTFEPKATVPTSPLPDLEPMVDWMMVATIAGVMLGALVLTCVIVAVVRWGGKRRNKHGE